MKVFILEDDPLVVLDYELVLNELGLEICGIANTVPKAIKQLKQVQPDFALVDLYVGNRLGFELVSYFNTFNIPVIICTGHPTDRSLNRSMEMNVFSFMSKPIVYQTLKFEITKLSNHLEKEKDHSFLYFKTKKHLIKILHSEINYVKADGNYCVIYTTKKRHAIKKSLVKIMPDLPKVQFVRIYRNLVLNISKITKVDLTNNKVWIAESDFPLSDKYKLNLKSALISKYAVIKV